MLTFKPDRAKASKLTRTKDKDLITEAHYGLMAKSTVGYGPLVGINRSIVRGTNEWRGAAGSRTGEIRARAVRIKNEAGPQQRRAQRTHAQAVPVRTKPMLISAETEHNRYHSRQHRKGRAEPVTDTNHPSCTVAMNSAVTEAPRPTRSDSCCRYVNGPTIWTLATLSIYSTMGRQLVVDRGNIELATHKSTRNESTVRQMQGRYLPCFHSGCEQVKTDQGHDWRTGKDQHQADDGASQTRAPGIARTTHTRRLTAVRRRAPPTPHHRPIAVQPWPPPAGLPHSTRGLCLLNPSDTELDSIQRASVDLRMHGQALTMVSPISGIQQCHQRVCLLITERLHNVGNISRFTDPEF
ncbi:hypothetical protein J6590_036711 [Homalodisca vitripennis]|nr:hypothetical protein J6590_036711 [Homalodisca vitripennis]